MAPRTPIVSVDTAGGRLLREALARGPVRVRLRTQVDTGWRPLPVLIAHLRAPRSGGDFLLFSGHVDSWHYGAMDNASANAVQLEVGRIMAARRRALRRDCACPSGRATRTPATPALCLVRGPLIPVDYCRAERLFGAERRWRAPAGAGDPGRPLRRRLGQATLTAISKSSKTGMGGAVDQ